VAKNHKASALFFSTFESINVEGVKWLIVYSQNRETSLQNTTWTTSNQKKVKTKGIPSFVFIFRNGGKWNPLKRKKEVMRK